MSYKAERYTVGNGSQGLFEIRDNHDTLVWAATPAGSIKLCATLNKLTSDNATLVKAMGGIKRAVTIEGNATPASVTQTVTQIAQTALDAVKESDNAHKTRT